MVFLFPTCLIFLCNSNKPLIINWKCFCKIFKRKEAWKKYYCFELTIPNIWSLLIKIKDIKIVKKNFYCIFIQLFCFLNLLLLISVFITSGWEKTQDTFFYIFLNLLRVILQPNTSTLKSFTTENVCYNIEAIVLDSYCLLYL